MSAVTSAVDGFMPPPRRLAEDSMDDFPSPRATLHLNDDSYHGSPAIGFEDSKAPGTSLFKNGFSDFGFLMKAPSTDPGSSVMSDDNDSAVISTDHGRKRVRTFTEDSMSTDIPGPPCPPVRPHDVPFGVVEGQDRGTEAMNPPIFRSDPYFWIRDQTHENEEVQKLLRDEDAYCKQSLSHLNKLRERLYAEMMGHTKEADVDVPAPHVDGYAYYSKSFVGKPYRAHCRARITSGVGCLGDERGRTPVAADIHALASLVGMEIMDEELIFDENLLSVDPTDGSNRPYLSVKGPALSHDDAVLSYGEEFEGNDCYTIRFRHFKSADQGNLIDVLEKTDGSMEWDAAGHLGMFYLGLDAELRAGTLHRHVLGTNQQDDVLMFEEKDQSFSLSIRKTHDVRYLLVSSCSIDTSEHHVVDLQAQQPRLVCVSQRQEGHQYQVDHCNGFLYMLTDKDGVKDMKLCRTPVAAVQNGGGSQTWQDVWVPNEKVQLNSLRCFEKFIAIEGREDGIRRIFILHYDAIGASNVPAIHTVIFPETRPHDGILLTPRRRIAATSLYSVGFHTMHMFNTPIMRLYRADYCCPSRIYSYNVASNEFKLLKEEPAPGFDSSQYRAERITSQRRGVPISLVYHTGVHPDGLQGGPHPTLLAGYGAYGSCQDPDFEKTLLSLLDRGVVYAVAHVRGGGELGKEWTEQGCLMNKKNGFLDFEAAAETLITTGISEAARLVAWGESSGGLLVGATVNMRPDLFKALLMEVPYVDCLNTMSDPTIPLTCGDWVEQGNTNEREAFQYIMEYSPYDNIRMQRYPAILCTASQNDAMVGFWEPLKYVAKLRRTKLDDNLAMVKVNFHAGHMHSSDRYEYLRERAFLFAFVLDQLGIGL